MGNKVPITITYLGKRGGGAKITAQISQSLSTSNIFSLEAVCIRSDNELANVFDQSKRVVLFNELLSTKTILKVIQYVLFPKNLLDDMRLPASGICLVPMISPLGLVIESILKHQGVTVIRLLHDFERHPGDKWPPKALIRRLVKKSNFLIVLSSEVARRVRNLNPNIRVSVYPHPVFDFSTSEVDVVTFDKYILFVGRIREYKGIENLIAAFDRLKVKDVELVIAGDGKLKVKIGERIKVINGWLQENEIASLVKNSEVVVFPYLEASQSGLLPYCVSQNKKVVVTPLPGLLEQTDKYKNAYVTKDFHINSLNHALKAAIESETFLAKTETPTKKNIESCLLESGFFTKK